MKSIALGAITLPMLLPVAVEAHGGRTNAPTAGLAIPFRTSAFAAGRLVRQMASGHS